MSMTMNRKAYEQLVAGDLEWLLRQPRTLERDHIELIVRHSANSLYNHSALLEACKATAAIFAEEPMDAADYKDAAKQILFAWRKSISAIAAEGRDGG